MCPNLHDDAKKCVWYSSVLYMRDTRGRQSYVLTHHICVSRGAHIATTNAMFIDALLLSRTYHIPLSMIHTCKYACMSATVPRDMPSPYTIAIHDALLCMVVFVGMKIRQHNLPQHISPHHAR